MTATVPSSEVTRLLQAALPHVPFDGWSPETFAAASRDCGMSAAEARAACPRGALDLAVAYHKAGDAEMVARLRKADMSAMRFRDKVIHAIKLRLDGADREAVRRGTALFSLPHLAPEGAKLMWGTADAIWTALGDPSDDFNWYSKRAILTAVYGSVVLFWLGDDSLDGKATEEFIQRRIDDVMQFEKVKAAANANPLLKPVLGPLSAVLSRVRKPLATSKSDLPGYWAPRK
jgi:ubiquinone biosynthesis protein COQ9